MSNPEYAVPDQEPERPGRPSALRRFAVPAALVVGGVTVGSFVAPIGLASAQDDADGQSDPTVDTGDDTDDGDAPRGRRGPHGIMAGGAEATVLSDVLGLDSDELRAAFAEGRSLADIAAEQGVTVEDLAAAMVAAAEERIDEAVADDRLDPERAEAMKAELAERVDAHINRAPGDHPHDGFEGRGHRGLRAMVGDRAEMGAELAEFLDLDSDELQAAFAEGNSLADVAAEQGVSEDDLVAFLMERLEARVDRAVADDRLDADRAEEILENAEERIQGHLDEVPGDKVRRGQRGHGHRGGPMGGSWMGERPGTGPDMGVTNDTKLEA